MFEMMGGGADLGRENAMALDNRCDHSGPLHFTMEESRTVNVTM